MVATTDSGIVVVAASRGSQVAVSPEPPDSPQQQSSSRAEGEGRGGLTAAAVHSSALDAVSSVYARVTDSDPARMPTPTSSADAAAAGGDDDDGEPPPTRRGGMARPGAAKGVRVASWSNEVTGGGGAADGAGGDGGDGSGGGDSGLGGEAEELLRMVDEAFLLAKRSHESEAALDALRRQCNDEAAAEVSTSDAAAAGAADDAAAEAGGKAGAGVLLLSSSVTPRVVTPRGGTRPQLDPEGVARVDSYKQAGRQHLKPRVPPPPAPRSNAAPHAAPTLPDRAAFFAPRAPPTSRGAPSRAPRPPPPPDTGALEILPGLPAPSPTPPPTAARADGLSARDARPTTSPPSVASPRAHYDFDFVAGLHDQAA